MNETAATGSLRDATTSGEEVRACLDDFLAAKAFGAAEQCLPVEIVHVLRDFVCDGGKLLRPELCLIGWCAAAGGGPAPAPVVRAAASLELFHAFALIHDDIMDRSATRRGRPSLHRLLANRYAAGREVADADHLGTSAAILAGDLALAWSDELLHGAGLTADRLLCVLPLIDGMREQVMYGQYLDITARGPAEPGSLDSPGTDAALRIAHYKTGGYTCEVPLCVGATLAGAPDGVLKALSAFARPLGEAFQLRDDLLGAFGDPATTGKPVLDDLREGRHTVLLALAWQRADPKARAVLSAVVGTDGITDEEALNVRHVLAATGARDEVEQMIATRRRRAHEALQQARLPAAVTARLTRVAEAATRLPQPGGDDARQNRTGRKSDTR
ncbi:polyprenyl synthetase family protein [Streptomyces sp. NPDC049555]|uniref:polyprenyl synthetase family protein n=1 Tax=Streptomyces sp. NPDC049555 TaxID=3154930 RepID=UPI00341E2107